MLHAILMQLDGGVRINGVKYTLSMIIVYGHDRVIDGREPYTVRGHYQIDVQCINRHVTAGLCFEYLGSYESSEHALSNEVW